MPENSVSIFLASTPHRLKYHLDGSNLTVSTNRIPTIRGRSRAASGPRQGAKNIRKSSETASPTNIFDFQDFWVMQFLRSRTRPCPTLFFFHELFWDTRAQPYQSTHIKAHSDGRILKTIVGIQTRKRKRAQNARKSC